jgi:hypothetical protein
MMSDLVLICFKDINTLFTQTPLIYGVAMFILIGVLSIILKSIEGR